jgi:fumarylacetoacetase
MPSVYNGRTSSLVVSGTPFHRPCGMYPDDAPRRSGSGSPQASVSVPISFKPESHMDYELEMAIWLSKPVPRSQRLKIANAQDHIFGLTLLNDWSARQIQRFEMPPLGPFHSKGSCTSVSPWIVPIEALQGEEVAQCSRKTKQEPPPPPHLTWQDDAAAAATFDIDLTVKLLSMSSPSHHAAMEPCRTHLHLLTLKPPPLHRRRHVVHIMRKQSQRTPLDALPADNSPFSRWRGPVPRRRVRHRHNFESCKPASLVYSNNAVSM